MSEEPAPAPRENPKKDRFGVDHRRRADDRPPAQLPEQLAQEVGEDVPENLTKTEASALIDRLLGAHRTRPVTARPCAPKS
jgi:hypothetical protein